MTVMFTACSDNSDKEGEEPGEEVLPPVEEVVEEFIEPDLTGMQTNVFDIAKAMNVGINIGNTLEAIGGENAWGNPNITPELMKAVKEAGFGAVRLPVAWDIHAEDGVIDAEWMKRVKEVVDYAMAEGLYVIINAHWDGGWLENSIPNGYSEAVNVKQSDYWKQIALTFRNYDEHLIFAGCNEPNVDNAAQMMTLKKYEQTFVDAVRSTGGRNHYRVLVIQGPSTDIDKTETLFGAMPSDVVAGRLMAEVHYYTPYQFCLMEEDASWGKCFYFWGDSNKAAAQKLGMLSRWTSTYGGEAYLKTEMAKMTKKFVNKGVPVILGEFCAMMERTKELAGNEEALTLNRKSIGDFNETVAREAKKAGLVPFLWDTGSGIDRNTGAILKDNLIPAVLAGAAAGNYPF